MFTATKIQITTYLLGVCLFSISFLVFLNASVSFVITDIIGQKKGIGNAVGTLGFADELVAIVACPVWGALSDRVGVQKISAIGYTIIGLALFIFVQAKDVYPGLLLARMFFSVGGAACTTMVTAILPSMSALPTNSDSSDASNSAPSVSSELTITPERAHQRHDTTVKPKPGSPSRVAGIVGMFTGCGALVALIVFLPLPTQFKKHHVTDAQALMDTFYVVAVVALAVALFCFLGLRHLQGEQHKTWRSIWRPAYPQDHRYPTKRGLSYGKLLLSSAQAGYNDYRIGLGYLGGFVARASSVGISLFIPLAINTYFISSGRCKIDPHDPSLAKTQCKEAYILSSQLTGVSQLVALLCAPLFGYFADKYRRFEIPLLIASVSGIVGYGAFAALDSPEAGGDNGSTLVFLIVCLLGISQIGAIVCSLGLLGRGVAGLAEPNGSSVVEENSDSTTHTTNTTDEVTNPGYSNEDTEREDSALLAPKATKTQSLNELKGSIAGTYSFLGGAGILLLTKLGGFLFDNRSPAAPFIMMAIFNALLFVGVVANILFRFMSSKQNV